MLAFGARLTHALCGARYALDLFREREPFQTETVLSVSKGGTSMGLEQAGSRAKSEFIATLQQEQHRVSMRITALNKEMMRLPTTKRRAAWQEYYKTLDWLMRRQAELSKAMDVPSR